MKEKIIYLLDYGISQELIFKIGWELRKNKFLVIPISPGDLMNQLGKFQMRFPIVSIILNQNHLAADRVFKKRYLLKALKNFRINSLEFSSFVDVFNQYLFINKSNTKQIGLPLDLKEIGKIIDDEFSKFFKEDMRWPGGRRGSIKELRER